ncbi:hypothetical protein [Thermococcus sp.]|uniref:hypothetical protein n=1 Tax=Thermococcus sp. TaxID=35749 RepID=UPI002605768D|nr:hypothetical protein [Thermococcus sp.]
MGEEDIEFITGQLQTTVLKLTKMQRSIEEVLSELKNVDEHVRALEENQNAILTSISALGKRIETGNSEISKEIGANRKAIVAIGEALNSSEGRISENISRLGERISISEQELRKAIKEASDTLTGQIVDLEYRISALDESIAMIKTLNTELKANIRAMTYELKKLLSELSSAEEERYQSFMEELRDFEEALTKQIELQERLLDIQGEKLEALRGELFELRESTLVNFGLLSSKFDAVEGLKAIERGVEDVRKP